MGHSPPCKHLGVFTEGETVFLRQERKKGSSWDLDRKPAPGSTGNILLLVSTASVSHCILVQGERMLGFLTPRWWSSTETQPQRPQC